MKKSLIFLVSLIILVTSVFSVMALAVGSDYADDMVDDDMDVNQGATTTTKPSGSIGGSLGDSDVGDFVGGVVSDVFQDEDVSEGVADKFDSILGIFDDIDLGGLGDKLGSLTQTTQKSTVGSDFFNTIEPVVTGGSYSGGTINTGGALTPTPTANVTTGLNGEAVDFNMTVNPYKKPTAELKPGDKGEGVKWLQWILIYTNCGLSGTVTGEYDDATATAVKTLQLTYNLAVDGIASIEVIEKAEEMFNNYISGAGVGITEQNQAFDTVTSPNSQNQNKTDKKTNGKVNAIIAALVIVWILAIAAAAIIIYIKKKNISLDDDGEVVKPKKQRNAKSAKAKNTKRTTAVSAKVSLKESETLQSLKDDEEADFDIVDFTQDEYDEDGEVILSSLSEMKKAIAKQNGKDIAGNIKDVTLKTEADVIPVKDENEASAESENVAKIDEK